jgi:RNA polymerase-binding transcription factor DksA
MKQEDLDKLKSELLKEKTLLEEELENTPLITDMGDDVEGDLREEETDEAEEMSNNTAIRNTLSHRLAAINEALAKIDRGEYNAN